MAYEIAVDWPKICLLAFYAFISAASIVIRYYWKDLFKCVPRLPAKKQWPSILISTAQLLAFLVLVYYTRDWLYSSVQEEASDFNKMDDFFTELETNITSAERSLKQLNFPKHAQVMKAELPIKLFEIEERTKMLKRIDMVNFENMKFWLTKNECGESDKAELDNAKETAKNVKSILANVTLDGPRNDWKKKTDEVRKETTELDNEKKKFEDHVSRTRVFLQRILFIWKTAKEHFRYAMMKATEHENTYLVRFYIISGLGTLFFGFWSPVCTLFFTKYQLDGYWTRLIRRAFYFNAISVILLSGYEIHANLTFQCSPIMLNYEFDDFAIPSYQSQSMVGVKSVFSQCIANDQTIFLATNNITEARKSNFTDGLKVRLTSDSVDVFNNILMIDIEVLKLKGNVDSINATLEKMKESCPESVGPMQPVLDIVKTMGHYSHIHKLSGSLEEMASDAFGQPMQRMHQFINTPVDQLNDIIRGTDIDCRRYQETYLHGYMLSCSAVNQVFIEHLKMAVIGCSALLVVLHMFYFRRADNTQFWNDPRVKWAHKFMTDYVDDEQFREWMTINNEDPPGVTYDHFNKRKNKKRNRFADVGLIDQSRVVLTNHVTDYIHASWIPIPGTNRRYIATQAPKPNTFKDFWHMLLQEEVKIAIMLTGFIELDNRICDHFFPFYKDEKVTYGHVEVTCTKIEQAPKESGLWLTERRTMKLVDLNHPDAPPHFLNHVWMMSWYMEMVPLGLERVNDLQRYIETLVTDDSPICVLDHTGVDRTGVYIGLDYAHSMIVQDQFTSMVDVVEKIAAKRWGVFSTFVPYFFLFASLTHRFIREGYLFHEDWTVPMRKYRDTFLNRKAKQDNWRGNKQISIHFWKYRYDPPWW